jgi:hypothetical protein
MKRIIIFLLILCGQIIFAQVDTRLVYVSNTRDNPSPGLSTLVFDVEAISNSGNVQINSFQDAIQLDANFRAQNPSVSFSNQLFPLSGYNTTQDYNTTTFPGRIRYIYTYNSGTKSTINTTYTKVLRISIQYTTGSVAGTISYFSGSLNYYVTDGSNNVITGVQSPIPSELDNIPLPVELSSFTASANQNSVNLKWQTATEVNNYGFEVERTSKVNSQTSNSWEKIGFVAGNGNSNSPKEYSFVDKSPIGGTKFQYRLKQIDNDGQFKYTDLVEVQLVPAQFELSQNYPNPFNPSTKISYTLPVDSKVSIKVYDILGKLVETLVDEQRVAGYYQEIFNAKNLSSGVYFYNITAGKFNQTRKMMIMK